MEIITAKATRTCPHCGEARSKITGEGAQIVLDWLNKEGKDPRETITEYRACVDGFSFKHGGQYAVIDEDVLGGDGRDTTRDRFIEETGHYIRLNDGYGRSIPCKGCAKWA